MWNLHECLRCPFCSRHPSPVPISPPLKPLSPRPSHASCFLNLSGYLCGWNAALHLFVFSLFFIRSEVMCACTRLWEIQCLNHREHKEEKKTNKTDRTEKCVLVLVKQFRSVNTLVCVLHHPCWDSCFLKPPVSPVVSKNCLGFVHFLLLW